MFLFRWGIKNIFFTLFTAVPLFFLYLIFSTSYEYLKSSQWTETTCTVSQVEIGQQTYEDSEGDSQTDYYLDIKYTYQVDEKTYVGTTYSYREFPEFSFEQLQKAKEGLKSQQTTKCHVNPENPEESTILLTKVGLFPLLALFFMPFIWMGLWFPFFDKKNKRITSQLHYQITTDSPETHFDSHVIEENQETENMRITPKDNVYQWIIWIGSGNLYASLVIGYSFFEAPKDFHLFSMASFLSLCVLAVWIILLRLWKISTLARIEIFLDSPTALAGKTYKILCKFKGNPNRISSVDLQLHADEIANYGSGSTISKEREEFYRSDFLDIEIDSLSRQEEITITFPDNIIPSFRSSSNEIRWYITTVITHSNGRKRKLIQPIVISS